MKKKTWILICPFILMGVLLMLTNNCKKPEDIIPTISIPVLSTSAVTSITMTTATCGGNITQGGGSSITVRGVCWSTSQSFTIDNCLNKTTDGADVGSFTSAITGLNPNTTYYVRAYAINSTGTGYGDMKSLTTTTKISDLTTTDVSSITDTTAVSGGNIIDDYGASVTTRGVCWSTSQTPTIANNKTSDGIGTGVFTSSIAGLILGTTYYVRAYATNSVGTAYGNEVSFTTFLSIGESYQGGKVAYILQPGDPGYIAGQIHGLIAAPSDQSTGAAWGCSGTAIIGADGTAIGTGAQNTIDIIAGCTTAGIAAKLCSDLVLGGYSDWYLPSKDELNKLYLNQAAIGGLSNHYWSSSEYDNNDAWRQTLGSPPYSYDKNYADYVRAVRSF